MRLYISKCFPPTLGKLNLRSHQILSNGRARLYIYHRAIIASAERRAFHEHCSIAPSHAILRRLRQVTDFSSIKTSNLRLTTTNSWLLPMTSEARGRRSGNLSFSKFKPDSSCQILARSGGFLSANIRWWYFANTTHHEIFIMLDHLVVW